VPFGQLLDDGGQLEVLEGAHPVGDQTHRRADDPPLPVDIAAEAREPVHAEGQIQIAPLLEPAPLGIGQHAVDQPLRIGGRQRVELRQRFGASVEPDLRVRRTAQMQIRCG
jgi:hypothetical protein